ncbi:MAG: transporter permease [Conexibacter sp.]|nr:transporter permease [Conexibacter sp.]
MITETAPLQVPPVAGRSRLRDLRGLLRRQPLMAVGLGIVVVLLLLAIFAPLIAPHPADAGAVTHPVDALTAPGGGHPLGTDQLGRDVLTRVLYGARTSLLIVLGVLALSALIGVPLGILAGATGGWLDDVIMRITDIFLAFPALLLALALATVLTPSAEHAALAIAVTWWPWYARLARGSAASIATRGYVEAARALGVPRWRVLGRHVLPNAIPPVVVQLSLDAAGIMLTSAALSFLGLGAQDPTPEWGLMVNQGQGLLETNWWVAIVPGVAIVLAAVGFNLLGDGLRTALDPKGGRR